MDIHLSSKTLKICLGIAVIAVVALLVFKVPISGLFTVGIFLLCPLMHIFMMKGMGHDHGSTNGHHHDQNHQPVTKVEEGKIVN